MAQFSIALSGLTAASSDWTSRPTTWQRQHVGFKDSRAEFADVYSAGAVNLNTSVVGQGVRLRPRHSNLLRATFHRRLQFGPWRSAGMVSYPARANGYALFAQWPVREDRPANVVSATGQALQVYPPLINGGFNTGTLTNLNLQTAQSAPLATTIGHR